MFTASALNKTRNLFRSYSLQTFDEYKACEAQCSRESAVTPEGTLLDYPDLWLRRNPSNVQIDNKSHPASTVITIDSANRPGTLVEVVQCLTELGLDIRTAQISSDGGWFVDVFTVEESRGGKVIDHRKLDMIRRVLWIDYESEHELRTPCDEQTALHCVLELVGQNSVTLLHEIAQVLGTAGLEIKSIAAWTQHTRIAIVIEALSGNRLLESLQELEYLRTELLYLLGSDGKVKIQNVKGEIHHERHLHRLLLQEAEGYVLESVEAPENSPVIQVTDWPRLKYWRVTIQSKDRTKLLYDTLCTMVDLGYQVYHASIVSLRQQEMLEQDFYIRPRWTDVKFCQKKAKKLKEMLISSVSWQQPTGVKVHVLMSDQGGTLHRLIDIFRKQSLLLTRAIVKCFTDELGSFQRRTVHTFSLLKSDGRFPEVSEVQRMLVEYGGQLSTQLTVDRVPIRVIPSQDSFFFSISQGLHHGTLFDTKTMNPAY